MNKGLKYKTIRGKLGFFGWASRIALIGWTVAMLDGWYTAATSQRTRTPLERPSALVLALG